MIKKFRLFNVFMIILASTVLASIVTLYAIRQRIDMFSLLFSRTASMPIIIYISIALIMMSAIIATVLYFGLKINQRQIVQKLQWLIIGNYKHPIFQENVPQTILLSSYTDVVDEQLNTLSSRLKELSEDRVFQKSVGLSLEEKTSILEEERHRIARELHDSVSQQLFAAMMLLSATNHSVSMVDDKLSKQLKIIEQTINAAQIEMRALLLHLRPVSLAGKTLKQGIEQLLSELKTKVNLNVNAQLSDVSVDAIIEDNLFRILQELVSNVLRHAKATSVELSMNETDDIVQLRLVDNGIGYDTEQQTSGYGLLNIKERVAVIGGTLSIVSVANQGTVVDIKIQKKEEKHDKNIVSR